MGDTGRLERELLERAGRQVSDGHWAVTARHRRREHHPLLNGHPSSAFTPDRTVGCHTITSPSLEVFLEVSFLEAEQRVVMVRCVVG